MQFPRTLTAISCLAIGFFAQVTSAKTPEPKTAAAVLAADEAWGAAEMKGDFAFVDRLLLPEYRSIGSSGKVTDKAKIVAGTRKRGPSKAYSDMVTAWKAAHPSRGDVTIDGDTAILAWTAVGSNGAVSVRSCDVFVYRSGRWRALYSQHTAAEGG
jgi:hypothetical protein